ncbi:MAG: hypothetical protein HQK73_05825 [Desulfamplus sp.]|nr:hypothetical protein [Desulfamplus sp.]MBF0411863.1 hypothetical protein [Desulfamplus sp.]
MIKIGTVTCTPDAADLVAQCYSSLPVPPKGKVRLIDTYVSTEGITQKESEYKAFSIFEYDDADENIINEYLERRFAAFSTIPGVKYKIEDWVRVAEALKMLADGEFNTSFISNTNF